MRFELTYVDGLAVPPASDVAIVVSPCDVVIVVVVVGVTNRVINKLAKTNRRNSQL